MFSLLKTVKSVNSHFSLGFSSVTHVKTHVLILALKSRTAAISLDANLSGDKHVVVRFPVINMHRQNLITPQLHNRND